MVYLASTGVERIADGGTKAVWVRRIVNRLQDQPREKQIYRHLVSVNCSSELTSFCEELREKEAVTSL